MKCEASQELVVGGFTDPQGGRASVSARCWSAISRATTSCSPARSARASTRSCCSICARGSTRIEIPESPFTKAIGLPARARALGATRDRRAGRVHRVDRARQAAASAAARRRRRQAAARGRAEDVVITHPEKVLFPDDGITKGELAAYYEAIAPRRCCRTSGRPVTMERFPAGIGEKGLHSEGRRRRDSRSG